MTDHMHMVLVIVSSPSGIVHQHAMTFIGPPGVVTVDHRSTPVEPLPPPDGVGQEDDRTNWDDWD